MAESFNAMAESVNSLYKSELIHKKGPWTGLEDVEFATLDYVDWFNNPRLHRSIGDVPPAEFEKTYYHKDIGPVELAVTQ